MNNLRSAWENLKATVCEAHIYELLKEMGENENV